LVDTLSKDAAQRPQTSEELAARIGALLEESKAKPENPPTFKATVAMGSWSVADMPELDAGPAAPPAGRSGPVFSQGAPAAGFAVPAAVSLAATPSDARVVDAAQVGGVIPAGPAPFPLGAPEVSEGPVAVQEGGGALESAAAPAVPPGYTRRPTGSARRRGTPHWGLIVVVGVLGSCSGGCRALSGVWEWPGHGC
jgi:hypothetical protein